VPKGWSAKDERMMGHIMDSGQSKQVAIATVNKYRGKNKKKRKKK
jgi:hypothetical protein